MATNLAPIKQRRSSSWKCSWCHFNFQIYLKKMQAPSCVRHADTVCILHTSEFQGSHSSREPGSEFSAYLSVLGCCNIVALNLQKNSAWLGFIFQTTSWRGRKQEIGTGNTGHSSYISVRTQACVCTVAVQSWILFWGREEAKRGKKNSLKVWYSYIAPEY